MKKMLITTIAMLVLGGGLKAESRGGVLLLGGGAAYPGDSIAKVLPYAQIGFEYWIDDKMSAGLKGVVATDGSFIVDPFGDVYKCWELVGLQEHVVGRLNEDGTMEQTDVYGDVLERDPTRIKQCASHSYLPSCGGGCVCKAYWQKGTYNTPGCGTENFLLPEKVRMAYEMTDPLISKTRINEGMEMQLVDGPVEPSMSHCYVLV